MRIAASKPDNLSSQNLDRPDAIRLPSFIPQFDGLRGISILAVMATHSTGLRALGLGRFVEYGRFGVDLFFVLSGFLITGILLDSRNSGHYFKNFYARRALRIWPMYYGVLILYAFLSLLPFRSEFLDAPITHWPYLIFYVQNCAPGYLLPWGLTPTWSLAVEEQFYMVWPTVVRLVRGVYFPILLWLLTVLSFATRLSLFKLNLPMDFVHHFTLGHLEPITFGSFVAWWIRSDGATASRWRIASGAAILTGLAGVLVTRLLWGAQSVIVSYFFLAMFFAGVLGLSAVSTEGSLLVRFLCARWLRYIGKISYGLYLIHNTVDLATHSLLRHALGSSGSTRPVIVVGTIFSFLLTLAIESAIWKYFETPLLRLKRYFAH